MVFVNGEPRVGDPYLTGQTIVPIVLRAGKNELLFHCAAGKVRAEVLKPQREVFFEQRDLTLPSLIEGETSPLWLGVLLVNCREDALNDCQATASLDSGSSLITKVGSIPPLGIRKVAIPLDPRTTKQLELSSKIPVELTLNEQTQQGTAPLGNFRSNWLWSAKSNCRHARFAVSWTRVSRHTISSRLTRSRIRGVNHPSCRGGCS